MNLYYFIFCLEAEGKSFTVYTANQDVKEKWLADLFKLTKSEKVDLL